jgi:hypothetical protein
MQRAPSRLCSPPVGAKIVATLTDASGKQVELMLRGDFWGGSADIAVGDGGPVIAQISRNVMTMRELVWDQQTVSAGGQGAAVEDTGYRQRRRQR